MVGHTPTPTHPSQMWWCVPFNSARQRQTDLHDFEASLIYIVLPVLTTVQTTKQRKSRSIPFLSKKLLLLFVLLAMTKCDTISLLSMNMTGKLL